MSVAAIAERVLQQPTGLRTKPSLDYKRGNCPRCEAPMLVHDDYPNALCVSCVDEEKPQLAIGTQPIPVDRSL